MHYTHSLDILRAQSALFGNTAWAAGWCTTSQYFYQYKPDCTNKVISSSVLPVVKMLLQFLVETFSKQVCQPPCLYDVDYDSLMYMLVMYYFLFCFRFEDLYSHNCNHHKQQPLRRTDGETGEMTNVLIFIQVVFDDASTYTYLV